MKLCWKVDMSRVLFWVAMVLGVFVLTVKVAEGTQRGEVSASLTNAYNGAVWARSTGINPPFVAIWEARTTDGRLMQREYGQTTQLTLDDEWRIITLIAKYGGKQYTMLSVRAKFKGLVPVYEVIQGDVK